MVTLLESTRRTVVSHVIPLTTDEGLVEGVAARREQVASSALLSEREEGGEPGSKPQKGVFRWSCWHYGHTFQYCGFINVGCSQLQIMGTMDLSPFNSVDLL